MSGDLFEALKTFTEAERLRLRVPGAALGVLMDGATYTAGLGVTNVLHPLPVDADTLFQIGSTTKTFTGTAVMQRVQAGRLDLDAPVRRLLPDLRLADEDAAARVTLRHVLTHTSGWEGDWFADYGGGDDALARYVADMSLLPQRYPPGALWSYCNSGFTLAGRVLEVLEGSPYEDIIREALFEPLAMHDSFFFADDAVTRRAASGHRVREGQPPEVLRPWAIPRCNNCFGGIFSSINDQMRYARWWLAAARGEDDGALLLRRDTAQAMLREQVRAGGRVDAMGITWMLRTVGGVRVVQHGGATNGQMSAFQFVPERRFAVSVLTNADTGNALHMAVTREALRLFLGASDPLPEFRDQPEEALAEYNGSYKGGLGRLSVSAQQGGLILAQEPSGGFPRPDAPPPPAPPPLALRWYAPDQFATHEGERVEFLRGEDGRVAWARLGVRLYRRAMGEEDR